MFKAWNETAKRQQEVLRAWSGIGQRQVDLLNSISKSARDAVAPALDVKQLPIMTELLRTLGSSPVLHLTRSIREQLTRTISEPILEITRAALRHQEAFERIAEAARTATPANWQEQPYPRVQEVIAFMRASGLVLAWIPRWDIIEELLAAGDSWPAALLLRRSDLHDDIEAALGEVSTPDLMEVRDFAEDALATSRAGHWRGAQALATNTFDTLWGSLGLEKADWVGKDPLEHSLNMFRAAAVIIVVFEHVLKPFFVSKGDAIPGAFARHASVHAVSHAQYTEVNSLVALMTLAALLRELESRS